MTATPTRSTAAVWRPGDPVGDRRFAAIGDLALERGGVLPDVTVAYETWGTLSPSGDNAVLVEHALTGDSHVVGDAGPGHASPGLVARPDRPRRPARHRPPVRRGEQRARRLPGDDRSGVRRPERAAVGWPLPVHHHPRPGGGRGRPGRRPRHPGVARRARWARWVACGCWSGWPVSPTGSSAPWCSPRRRTPRPTRWRGASRSCSPSGPTPPTAVATTTTGPSGRSPAWGSRAGSPTRPTGTRPSSTTASGVGPRVGRGPARRRGPLRRRELPRPPRHQARRVASTRTATSCSPRR